jgi:glycosyltransferase involved in cell wall biosynthesis
MELVIRQAPSAHLLLIGAAGDPAYREVIEREIAGRDLARNVSLLGQRMDIPAVLRACDIGVLSSASEGLPLALIEYGMSRLPAVATRVGQCPEVLLEGEAGLLVPPGSPGPMAEALQGLLASPDRRSALASRLHSRVQERYGADSAIGRIQEVYTTLMGTDSGINRLDKV